MVQTKDRTGQSEAEKDNDDGGKEKEDQVR